MPRWTDHGPEDDGESGLGDECEAFLAGRWVDYRETCGRPVPSWAWMNQLAHADRQELQRIADPGQGSRHGTEPWSQASSFLAGELLDLSQRAPGRIAELQREALIPFELSLFDDPAAKRLNAGQLLARALATLPDRSSRTA